MLIGYVQTTLTVLMMGWLFDCAIQIVRGIVLRGPTMHDLRVPILWLTVYTSATSARPRLCDSRKQRSKPDRSDWMSGRQATIW